MWSLAAEGGARKKESDERLEKIKKKGCGGGSQVRERVEHMVVLIVSK